MHIIGVLWVTNAALYAVAPLDLCNDAKRLTPWLFAVHRSLPIRLSMMPTRGVAFRIRRSNKLLDSAQLQSTQAGALA
jgi:hypothetical protein